MSHPVITQVSPDTIDSVGRALASNNDWRAMLIVATVIILALIAERGLAAWGIRQERRQMAAEREASAASIQIERDRLYAVGDKFVAAADKMGDNVARVSEELAVLRAVSSRVEANAEKG